MLFSKNGIALLFGAMTALVSSSSQEKVKVVRLGEEQERENSPLLLADAGILLSHEEKKGETRAIIATDNIVYLPERSLQSSDCPVVGQHVDCVNGVNQAPPYDSCADACSGSCCVGLNACKEFTGRVCKDGISCSGESACNRARIPLVSASCDGYKACRDVGFLGLSMGNIIASCHSIYACAGVGILGGKVGNIESSCSGDRACHFIGSEGGTVGNVLNSCVGDFRSCAYVGTKGGVAGNLQGSCNAHESCFYLGRVSVGDVTSSCNAPRACLGAGSPFGVSGPILSDLTECCIVENACLFASEVTLIG